MILASHGIIASSGGTLQPIVTNDLILHYDAGNSLSYPGSGAVIGDLSPSANNGIFGNGVTYNTNYGGTLIFDGVIQYLQPQTRPTLTNQMTLEIWCNLDAVVSNDKWLVGVEYSYRILYNGTSMQLVVQTANNGWYSSGTFITVNTTSHINNNCQVVVSYNGSRLNFYINGVLQSTTSTNISGNLNVNANPYLIMYDGSGSGGIDYGKGKIYQNRLYNVALSDANVLNNFNANKSKFGL
jgi:hypothetical protein